jgi:6-phosphogluconolactonase (cycloisomerase 2 family)
MRLRTTNNRGTIQLRYAAAELRIMVAAAVALTALGILSGCSSSSSNVTHLAFVAGGVNAVSAYRVNNKSGSASVLVGSPYVAGNSPSSVVVHPSGQFLYVANQADSTISLFTINSTTGALTEVLPRASAGGFSPGFMTMDSGGSFLFVANQSSNDVWAFQIGSAGALTQVSSVSVGSSPAGLALTSSGFLYVPVPNFSAIAVLSANSGVLQVVGSFPVNNGVGGVAVGSGAKVLYATNPATNTVSAFTIQAGGSLTALPGLTMGTGTTPVIVATDLTGSFLYVANSGSGSISQFKIDSTTGALTAFTTASVSVGTNPVFVVADLGGKFIFVGNTGSRSVTELSINSDGSLTSSNTISPGFVPRSLAVTK